METKPAIPMANIQILLVEDAVGRPIVKVLETWGYHVDLAEDGETGWEMLNGKRYDILLVDWMLPGISGVELVQKARAEDTHAHMPIVMISGNAGRENIISAVGSGIDSYLAKPFTAVQIRDKIEAVWEKHRDARKFSDQIRGVVENQLAIDSGADRPLVIFGERFDTIEELSHQDHRDVARFLCSAIRSIAAINNANPELNLGYVIMTSTGQIVDQLKDQDVLGRVRAVLLSAECSGSPVLFARQIRENFAGTMPILLCCESVLNLSSPHRAGLQKYAIPILERAELGDAEILELLSARILPAAPETE